MNNIIAFAKSWISIGLHIKSRYQYIGKRLDKITTDNKLSVKYTLIMTIMTKRVFRLKSISSLNN